jgi:AraC-like DNA-binding protein
MASRSFSVRRHVVMLLARRGVPHATFLGRYNYTKAHPALSEHAHGNALEICFLVKGRQTYRVGGRNYRLRGGDVFLTFPNEVHSTDEAPQEKGALYWLILRLPRPGELFLGLPRTQGRAVLRGLLEIPSHHFSGSPQMKEHLDAITVLHEQPPTPLGAVQLSNRVHAFLLEVIRCSRRPAAPRHDSFQPILDEIARHPEETPRVPELAAKAGLSVARFSARFKRETGVPPAEYILRMKIEEARRRLERGTHSVTQIAYDLGFSSSQYFATAFKRLEGRTPGEARQSPRLKPASALAR